MFKLFNKNLSKKVGKVKESIQSSTTPDPGHRMGKCQKDKRKHHGKDSQEVCPFPTGAHKAAKNWHGSMVK